jgi:integrase
MAKAVSVHRVKHPRYRYKVSFREVQPDGLPVRRFAYFATRGEADAFATKRAVEIANHGARHSAVEDEERAALIRFRTWASQRESPPTLASLLEQAITAYENARPPFTVAEAVNLRLEAARRRGLSARHLADLESRLDRFSAQFGTRQLADLKAAAVEAWLHRLEVGPETWRNYAKVIGSVFALAVKRGLIDASPMRALDKPKVVRRAPEILTPSQLSDLLTAAVPSLRPLLVLQAFCGLRRAEAERLSWSHIHLADDPPYVELPGSVTKTSRRRICELQPCAVAWLKPLAGKAHTTLGLTETVYRDRLRTAAQTANIIWSNNVLRHSFGTYRLASTRNAALVAEEMGNSAAIVRTHYANIVSPAVASEYWALVPEKQPIPVPEAAPV